MFGIGGWEFVLIAVLALLLFGPDKLPQFARTLGRFMRDFKRYQDLMESTIRAEVFANDPSLRKDPFKTGKEFRERVASGGFAKPAAEGEAAKEPEATAVDADVEAEKTAPGAEPSEQPQPEASPDGVEGEGEQEA